MTSESSIHHLRCSNSLRASVILLHGYASAAQAQLGDGEAFVTNHMEVLLPDAPGHGCRENGRLARTAALPDDERPAAIREIAREWLGELPELAAQCRARGAESVGLVGISMGGFAALGALAQPCSFDAVAAVLAAPALVDRGRVKPGEPPLLLGLAGKDCAVPPGPGREFAQSYGAELHEYPDSEHFMREPDWFDLWGHVGVFLRAHLAADLA